MKELFANCAHALISIILDPSDIIPAQQVQLRAEGNDMEALLVNWLNECLYVLDVEGFVACRVEFITFVPHGAALGGEPLRLHCLLHGEESGPDRHDSRPLLGTFSPKDASIIEGQDGVEARVVTHG